MRPSLTRLPAAPRTGIWSLLLVLLFGLASWSLGHAQNARNRGDSAAAPAVSVTLTQMQVVQEKGKEVLRPADSVAPGDIVEYEATYFNASTQPVRKLLATLPLEEGLIYQARSAHPDGARTLAATKDGRYAAEPLMRVTKAGGKAEQVPYEDYRFIRWEIDHLDPGQSVKVRARARVTPLSAADAAPKTAAADSVPLAAAR